MICIFLHSPPCRLFSTASITLIHRDLLTIAARISSICDSSGHLSLHPKLVSKELVQWSSRMRPFRNSLWGVAYRSETLKTWIFHSSRKGREEIGLIIEGGRWISPQNNFFKLGWPFRAVLSYGRENNLIGPILIHHQIQLLWGGQFPLAESYQHGPATDVHLPRRWINKQAPEANQRSISWCQFIGRTSTVLQGQ